MESNEIRQELAQYSRAMRIVEIAALLSFGVFFVVVAANLVRLAGQRLWILPIATVLGLLIMDFLSGLVHWFADTWGSARWFILGPALIRSFREHHVDRNAITRHDFIETNGATALVALPLLGTAFAMRSGVDTYLELLAMATLASISFWALWTNQFHKWAHTTRTPAWVKPLQAHGIFLSISHHNVHHSGIFDHNYCITTGWLNPVLDKIGFFRKAEALITWLTGAVPRAEDIAFTGK